MKYIPKPIRILTGKLEMRLRSSANYRERIRFIDYAFMESLPEILPPKKTGLKDNIIWQYWDTGAVNAPELIKVCIESVEKHKDTHLHYVLCDENIMDYIHLPDYITKNWNLINPTKRSNILRLSLLTAYGGMWIDASCFISGEIPEQYFNIDFFAYSNQGNDRILRNWFLCGKINHPVFNALLRMHFKFYQNYLEPPSYFFFHYLFENLVTLNKEFRHLWMDLKTEDAIEEDEGLLRLSMGDSDRSGFIEGINQTWIHKLSWKLNPDVTNRLLLFLRQVTISTLAHAI